MTRPPRSSIIANFSAIASNEDPSSGDPTSEAGQKPVPPSVPRVGAGVIGATQRSLSDIREERDELQKLLAGRNGIEIEPSLIDPSPFPDRLPDDDNVEFNQLIKLIAEEGQKVPIQVRRHPSKPGRFEIVYGHRRWRAARELKIAVKATIVELTDSELVIAQGIENSARQDLSWIERALFAHTMDEAGIKARDIRAALNIDDPELAKLRFTIKSIPRHIITAIGRAPKIGRPRWVELAKTFKSNTQSSDRAQKILSSDKVETLPSDERFALVFKEIKEKPARLPAKYVIESAEGVAIGSIASRGKEITLSLAKSPGTSFIKFLGERMPALLSDFERFGGHDE